MLYTLIKTALPQQSDEYCHAMTIQLNTKKVFSDRFKQNIYQASPLTKT